MEGGVDAEFARRAEGMKRRSVALVERWERRDVGTLRSGKKRWKGF